MPGGRVAGPLPELDRAACRIVRTRTGVYDTPRAMSTAVLQSIVPQFTEPDVVRTGEDSTSSVGATHTGREILEKLDQVPPLSAEDAAVMLRVVEENRAKDGG